MFTIDPTPPAAINDISEKSEALGVGSLPENRIKVQISENARNEIQITKAPRIVGLNVEPLSFV